MSLTQTKPVDLSPFRHLYPFESNFTTVNGLSYHYLDQGRGEPLVMVHGNPTWSFFFRRLVTAFQASHRVIVPDHIGCGLSDKPDTNGYDFRLRSRVSDLSIFLDRVVPDQPVTLLVHDWGGMIGLAWALDHPGRVNRVVIMNTAGFFPPHHQPIPLRLKLLRKPNPIMDRAVVHLNLFARAALTMAPRHRLPRDIQAGLIAPYNCPRNRLATLKFVQDIPLSRDDPSGQIVAHVDEHLYQLNDLPVLVLWGAHDFVFNRAYYEEWRRRLSHAQFYWLENAGHYLLEDQPEFIIQTIRQFFQNHAKP